MSNSPLKSALDRAINFLLSQQNRSGYFEGEISSSTFSTCAYGWVQRANGKTPDRRLREWLIRQQNSDGTWGLDIARIPDRTATLLAELTLDRSGEIDLSGELGLTKLAYAYFGKFAWKELTPPKIAIFLLRFLTDRFPNLRLKRSRKFLPTPDFFHSRKFQSLFVAEQQTLVPAMLLMELNGRKRPEMIENFVHWLGDRMLDDGSWFGVTYITALATLALMALETKSRKVSEMIEGSLLWLDRTRNSDGGCREVLNLNIWDTALSLFALTEVMPRSSQVYISKASKWLMENQNIDGGWAFSASPGGLLSDADDTAMTALALIRSKIPEAKSSIDRGLNWLKNCQSTDGSWSTYIPGEGDIGSVSITAHAVEALVAAEGISPPIERAIDWLERSQNRDGSWDDFWLARKTYGTSCAISAMTKANLESSVSAVDRAVQWLESVQNSDGGWGEDLFGNRRESTVEQTAWSSRAILLKDLESSSGKRGIKFLLDRQNSDGSWDSSCVGIYWEIIGGYSNSIYSQIFPLMAIDLSVGC